MMMGGTCLDDSPTGRILKHLQHFGTCTMKEMVSALGVTQTAVRQPLAALIAEGLVTAGTVRDKRGRPPLSYQLSDKARKMTSPWLENLALMMLEEVLESANQPEGATPMQRLGRQMGKRYAAHLDGHTPSERLEALQQWLEQNAIPSDVVEEPDSYDLKTYGCPYYGLATQHREVCQMEVEAMAQALGAPLDLVQSQLDGHHGCCFRMKKAAVS